LFAFDDAGYRWRAAAEIQIMNIRVSPEALQAGRTGRGRRTD